MPLVEPESEKTYIDSIILLYFILLLVVSSPTDCLLNMTLTNGIACSITILFYNEIYVLILHYIMSPLESKDIDIIDMGLDCVHTFIIWRYEKHLEFGLTQEVGPSGN